ncbi:EamA family transporter ['Osedax' symbiont bacterium Rs2_46_30_T18]|nr:EamA family transporter ['Osedax' symbiont bacterium Rs2_46_30_T18]
MINSKDTKSFWAIMYMLIAMFSLSTMDAFAKLLVKGAYDPLQILAIRSWIILAVLLLYYFSRKQLVQLKANRLIPQLLRGGVGFLAPYCFFKSLQSLPLADATIIFFSSTFMITALSWPLLREKVGVYRWSAVVIGFIGVLIAMDPQGGGDKLSYLYCLFGSFCYSLLFLSGRYLSKTESVVSLVFFFNLSMAIVSTSLAPLVWVPVATADYLSILMFSVLGLLGHFCVTKAFSISDVGLITPLEYTALIWAVLWGYLLWGEVPQVNVWIGAGIIVLCALFVIYRESVNKKRALRAANKIAVNSESV